MSVDAVLFKAFKFFDLYNNGWLSRTDFFKAIAKCGVVVDTHVICIVTVRMWMRFIPVMTLTILAKLIIVLSLKICCLATNRKLNRK